MLERTTKSTWKHTSSKNENIRKNIRDMDS
jgi:hypothetical protein